MTVWAQLAALSALLLPLLVQADATKPFTLSQVWALNGVYVDQAHGLSFRYPKIWQAAKQFMQIPPRLTQTNDALAGFAYSEGGFPRSRVVGPYSGTNLEGFGVVYSVSRAANSAACDTQAASLSGQPKQAPATFGGRSYSLYLTEDAGMSQSMSGHLYATYARGNCYLLETDVGVVAPGVADGAETLTPAQQQQIANGLLAILQSVRIQ
jgi:hypothetical protein